MRKNRNIVVLICSIIMVLGVLAGCSSQNASTGSSANAGANATQVVQATPEVTPSSAVEVASSEAQQPASQESTAQETASSAEAATDNPYIIDGIDFTDFYEGKKSFKNYFNNEMKDWSSAWLVQYMEEPRSIIGIYKNGDSIKWEAGPNVAIELYSKKKIVSYERLTEKENEQYSVRVSDGTKGGGNVGVTFKGKNSGGDINYAENMEMSFRFTYEDGTTEDITIYITAE